MRAEVLKRQWELKGRQGEGSGKGSGTAGKGTVFHQQQRLHPLEELGVVGLDAIVHLQNGTHKAAPRGKSLLLKPVAGWERKGKERQRLCTLNMYSAPPPVFM